MIKFNHISVLITWAWLVFGLLNPCQAQTVSDLQQQKDELFSLIDSRDYSLVQSKIDQLLVNSAHDPGLPAALFDLAGRWRDVEEFDRAGDLYQQVTTLSSDSGLADNARFGMASMAMKQELKVKDFAKAQVELDQLLAEFADHPEAAANIQSAAKQHEWSWKFDEAGELYARIIQQYPDSDLADDARYGQANMVVHRHLKDKNFSQARVELDKLVNDFPSHPDIASSIFSAARQHEWSWKFEEAKEIFSLILNRYPDSDVAEDARYGRANMAVHHRLKEKNFSQARMELNKLLSEFPNHPDAASSLFLAARQHEWSWNFKEANALYARLIHQYPDSEHVNEAWDALGITQNLETVREGSTGEALQAAEEIATMYSAEDVGVNLLHGLAAEAYFKLNDYDLAAALAQTVVDGSQPVDDHVAVWSYVYLAREEIEAGNDQGVVTLCDRLLLDYKDYWHMPYPVYFIAEIYAERGETAKMAPLMQRIADYAPVNLQNQLAREIITLLQEVRQHDFSGVQTRRDGLLASYTAQSGLDNAVGHSLLLMAEAFYKEGFRLENAGQGALSGEAFMMVVETVNQLVQRYPTQENIPTALYIAAESHRRQGAWQEAIAVYQKIVNDWPESEKVLSSHYLIGDSYEQLKKSGQIEEAVANDQTRLAYEQLVSNYPESKAAKAAQNWLKNH